MAITERARPEESEALGQSGIGRLAAVPSAWTGRPPPTSQKHRGLAAAPPPPPPPGPPRAPRSPPPPEPPPPVGPPPGVFPPAPHHAAPHPRLPHPPPPVGGPPRPPPAPHRPPTPPRVAPPPPTLAPAPRPALPTLCPTRAPRAAPFQGRVGPDPSRKGVSRTMGGVTLHGSNISARLCNFTTGSSERSADQHRLRVSAPVALRAVDGGGNVPDQGLLIGSTMLGSECPPSRVHMLRRWRGPNPCPSRGENGRTSSTAANSSLENSRRTVRHRSRLGVARQDSVSRVDLTDRSAPLQNHV